MEKVYLTNNDTKMKEKGSLSNVESYIDGNLFEAFFTHS